jgi:hypothetical protein
MMTDGRRLGGKEQSGGPLGAWWPGHLGTLPDPAGQAEGPRLGVVLQSLAPLIIGKLSLATARPSVHL